MHVGYLTLFSIAVTNLFRSFQDLRLIRFSLARFDDFLCSYSFYFGCCSFKELDGFFKLITVCLLHSWVYYDKSAIQGYLQQIRKVECLSNHVL